MAGVEIGRPLLLNRRRHCSQPGFMPHTDSEAFALKFHFGQVVLLQQIDQFLDLLGLLS